MACLIPSLGPYEWVMMLHILLNFSKLRVMFFWNLEAGRMEAEDKRGEKKGSGKHVWSHFSISQETQRGGKQR